MHNQVYFDVLPMMVSRCGGPRLEACSHFGDNAQRPPDIPCGQELVLHLQGQRAEPGPGQEPEVVLAIGIPNPRGRQVSQILRTNILLSPD